MVVYSVTEEGMVKERDFEAGKNFKKSNIQFFFMPYVYFWSFSGCSMVSPYTKLAKKRH